MNTTFWYVIEIAGFVTGGVLFILCIILFFKLHIYSVMQELSEKHRQRGIARIQKQRDSVSMGRDRRQSRRAEYLKKREQEKIQKLDSENSTEKLSQDEAATMKLNLEKTTVLSHSEATTVLVPDKQFYIYREILLINTEERIK